jgi:hypothetical protein
VTEAVTRFEALLSAPGHELLDRLAAEHVTADTALRINAALRREYPGELIASALAQHELRLLAAERFSRASQMFFTRPGLEQASSEATARHRAGRFDRFATVVDLCTGIGGDLIALARQRPALAVDVDPLHLRMAELNARAYGGQTRLLQADARDVDLAGVEAVFVDPARRVEGGRRLGPGRSEPELEWCFGLAERVPHVGVKAAPGLPRQLVPSGWEAEFIAVDRDLKEAALWSPALATTTRRATILPGGHVLLPDPGPAVDVRAPGDFLYDPNPAVTRAGLVRELARTLGAWQIDERIAFLSTDAEVHSPFARTLRVIASLPWHHKALAQSLRALDIGAVDIRRRGLAGNVDDVQRRLKLRGSRKATLVMTRVSDRPWAVVCIDP